MYGDGMQTRCFTHVADTVDALLLLLDMAFRIFCDAVLAGRPLEVFGDGDQTRDFTFVADVVAATRAAGELQDSAAACSTSAAARVSASTTRSRLLEELAGHPLDVRQIAGSARRRAGHGRRHLRGAGRARLRAVRRLRGRAARGMGVGDRGSAARRLARR